MNVAPTIIGALADLFVYPESAGAFPEDLAARLTATGKEKAAANFKTFLSSVSGLALEDRQELFTRTFDLNPVCSLEIGWHLFGEDYNRGVMLARMRSELRRVGVEENGELPDHLTHALALLERLEGEEAESFLASCLRPALDKMLAGMKEKNNPYESLLLCVRHIVAGPDEEGEKESIHHG